MFDTIWQYAAPLLGAGIAWLLKRYLDAVWWERIRKLAYAILADPQQTDDAKKAVATALLTAQADRLAAEAQRVKEAFLLNGKNTVPVLDIDITEEK
jgi:putative NADPH-quinone reductase